MSAVEIVNQLQYKNYVPPVNDYNVGRRIFRQGVNYDSCTTDAMRSGWLAAEGRAMHAAMQGVGMAGADALLAATL